MLQELFITAATNTLEKKKPPKTNTNVSKKWFDRDCNKLKKETRKIGREKNRDPSNTFLREKYNEKLKQYKRNCKSKRYLYWQNIFVEIEKALHDPKVFWKTWKNSAEKHESLKTPEISGDRWFNHFSNLHTKSFENALPPFVPNQPDVFLNQPFTKKELSYVIKNLKNGKAVGYDKISNEMIKNTPEQVMTLILDFINLCVDKSIVSQSLCYDIIHTIFKSDDKSDPNNYRGICLSSILLKLITSLISQRLTNKAEKLNLISKNQIGFRKKSRTADHLLTLKKLSKKYVTTEHKKLFMCFIDL